MGHGAKIQENPDTALRPRAKSLESEDAASWICFQEPPLVNCPPTVSEDRWIAIGISDRGRLLVVSHAYREGRARIISARKATGNEVREHEQG